MREMAPSGVRIGCLSLVGAVSTYVRTYTLLPANRSFPHCPAVYWHPRHRAFAFKVECLRTVPLRIDPLGLFFRTSGSLSPRVYNEILCDKIKRQNLKPLIWVINLNLKLIDIHILLIFNCDWSIFCGSKFHRRPELTPNSTNGGLLVHFNVRFVPHNSAILWALRELIRGLRGISLIFT